MKDSDICYSLFLDVVDVFAEVFADSYFGRCFMMADVAESDRICIPLHGFRLLSIYKKRNRGEDTRLVVEYMKLLWLFNEKYDTMIYNKSISVYLENYERKR